MDFDLVYKLMTLALPYETPAVVENAIVSLLQSEGFTLKRTDAGNEGVMLASGMYAIYQGNKRQMALERVIGGIFTLYSMSRELYDDLAAKMTVLRTLTQTLSILAATSSTEEGIEKVSKVISSETGFDDIIFAFWDGGLHILYSPHFISQNTLKDIVERSVFSEFHKLDLQGYVLYPHSYATDDGIFFIGLF